MTYTLAKELKDAGFPFESHVPVLAEDINGNPVELDEYVVDRFPTLSELIESCGKKHLLLRKCGGFGGPVCWEAYESHKLTDTPKGEFIDFEGKSAYGSTPEEAVARLWLALQKA